MEVQTIDEIQITSYENNSPHVQPDLINHSEKQSTINSSPEDPANKKIVSPKKLNLALLHSIHVESGMEQSFKQPPEFSSNSIANSDICVLDTHESHYGNKFDEEKEYCEHLGHSDFTVLLHNNKKDDQCNSTFYESTEVIMIDSSDCQKHSVTISCTTDSDVEVLNSREIIDFDWSASNESDIDNNDQVVSIKRQESTDRDISSLSDKDIRGNEYCSDLQLHPYGKMDQTQLLKIIQDQGAHIRKLEAILQRYRSAQQSLFAHVDAIRIEFAPNDINQ